VGALSRARLAKGTQRSYGYGIALFARWLEQGGGALETLAESDIRSYKHHLKMVLRRRPATINQQMNVIRWLCRWAQARGILKGDLVDGAELDPVPPRRRPVGLTEAEVHRLLRAAGQGRPSQRARVSTGT
jgi:site-specific recombinase XerD